MIPPPLSQGPDSEAHSSPRTSSMRKRGFAAFAAQPDAPLSLASASGPSPQLPLPLPLGSEGRTTTSSITGSLQLTSSEAAAAASLAAVVASTRAAHVGPSQCLLTQPHLMEPPSAPSLSPAHAAVLPYSTLGVTNLAADAVGHGGGGGGAGDGSASLAATAAALSRLSTYVTQNSSSSGSSGGRATATASQGASPWLFAGIAGEGILQEGQGQQQYQQEHKQWLQQLQQQQLGQGYGQEDQEQEQHRLLLLGRRLLQQQQEQQNDLIHQLLQHQQVQHQLQQQQGQQQLQHQQEQHKQKQQQVRHQLQQQQQFQQQQQQQGEDHPLGQPTPQQRLQRQLRQGVLRTRSDVQSLNDLVKELNHSLENPSMQAAVDAGSRATTATVAVTATAHGVGLTSLASQGHTSASQEHKGGVIGWRSASDGGRCQDVNAIPAAFQGAAYAPGSAVVLSPSSNKWGEGRRGRQKQQQQQLRQEQRPLQLSAPSPVGAASALVSQASYAAAQLSSLSLSARRSTAPLAVSIPNPIPPHPAGDATGIGTTGGQVMGSSNHASLLPSPTSPCMPAAAAWQGALRLPHSSPCSPRVWGRGELLKDSPLGLRSGLGGVNTGSCGGEVGSSLMEAAAAASAAAGGGTQVGGGAHGRRVHAGELSAPSSLLMGAPHRGRGAWRENAHGPSLPSCGLLMHGVAASGSAGPSEGGGDTTASMSISSSQGAGVGIGVQSGGYSLISGYAGASADGASQYADQTDRLQGWGAGVNAGGSVSGWLFAAGGTAAATVSAGDGSLKGKSRSGSGTPRSPLGSPRRAHTNTATHMSVQATAGGAGAGGVVGVDVHSRAPLYPDGVARITVVEAAAGAGVLLVALPASASASPPSVGAGGKEVLPGAPPAVSATLFAGPHALAGGATASSSSSSGGATPSLGGSQQIAMEALDRQLREAAGRSRHTARAHALLFGSAGAAAAGTGGWGCSSSSRVDNSMQAADAAAVAAAAAVANAVALSEQEQALQGFLRELPHRVYAGAGNRMDTVPSDYPVHVPSHLSTSARVLAAQQSAPAAYIHSSVGPSLALQALTISAAEATPPASPSQAITMAMSQLINEQLASDMPPPSPKRVRTGSYSNPTAVPAGATLPDAAAAAAAASAASAAGGGASGCGVQAAGIEVGGPGFTRGTGGSGVKESGGGEGMGLLAQRERSLQLGQRLRPQRAMSSPQQRLLWQQATRISEQQERNAKQRLQQQLHQQLQEEGEEAEETEVRHQQSQKVGACELNVEQQGSFLPERKPVRNRSNLAPIPLCLSSLLTSELPQSPGALPGYEPSPTSTLGSPMIMSLLSAFSSLSNSPLSTRTTPHGLDGYNSFSNLGSPSSPQEDVNTLPMSSLGQVSAPLEGKAPSNMEGEKMDLELHL